MRESLANVSMAGAAGGGYLAGWLLGGKGVLVALLLVAAFFAYNHFMASKK